MFDVEDALTVELLRDIVTVTFCCSKWQLRVVVSITLCHSDYYIASS